ncbi:uncharacterized protein LOC112451730 [Temnothorax curvispinosus]|uniref:Uncharacterized protein LOC112451730 n=1 Tax=Temnothorax curvispinosus TaxID=300111 RepID=A0A6J1PDH9_9HYME|nr:uncharacterized protein LOC112451730 [Temnothorax curvispinosus]
MYKWSLFSRRSNRRIENCTQPGTYDFFSNSGISVIFTFLGVSTLFCASEWQEPRASLRYVILVPNVRKNQLEVKNQLGHLIRAVDFPSNSRVMIYCASDSYYMLICVHHSYDLVLKFDSDFLRSAFIKAFEKFISEISTSRDAHLVQMITNTTHAALLKQAIIKKHRQKKLEMFFCVVFAQVFHIAHTEEVCRYFI